MPVTFSSVSQVAPQLIDLPFSFSPTGAVSTVKAYSDKAWRNRIKTVLMTNRGSRVWYDRYGAALPNVLTFENIDYIAGTAKAAISEAFVRWLPEIELSDVLYNYDWNTSTLKLSVVYVLPDGTEDSIALNYNSVNTSGNTLQAGWNG